MTPVAVGNRLTLWPLTHKGENRLREAGTRTWEVLLTRDSVLFNPEPGPWLLVAPCTPDDRKRDDKSRWIHGRHDPDFQIREVS